MSPLVVSPLSSSPPDSSFLSFHSAREEPASSSTPTPLPPSRNHRKAVSLPYELLEHIKIDFEEGLHIQALNSLTSLLCQSSPYINDIASEQRQENNIYVAPPSFMSYIATVSVHPSFTNRARATENKLASAAAFRYLGDILQLLGPIDGQFNKAFAFGKNQKTYEKITGSNAESRGQRMPSSSLHEVKQGELGQQHQVEIENGLADTGALWRRGEDVWHMIGWVFNCSIRHRKRWTEVWMPWLEFFITLLEEDWRMRSQIDQKEADDDSSITKSSAKLHSLIIQYVRGDDPDMLEGWPSASTDRRILRAIFANGSPRSLNEFPEIWPKETKTSKDTQIGNPRSKSAGKVDIDEDNYGDYDEQETDEEEEDEAVDGGFTQHQNRRQRLRRRGVSDDFGETDDADTTWNGHLDSIDLRMRLLALVFEVSLHFPLYLTTTDRILNLVHDHVRYLPLTMFLDIMSPQQSQYFSNDIAMALTQSILRDIVVSNAPQNPTEGLNQQILEVCYLPWAANSTGAVDNAKVSLCLENLLRLLFRRNMLCWTEEFEMTIENGIEERSTRSLISSRRAKDHDEGMAYMNRCAARMRLLVAVLKRQAFPKIERR